MTNAEKAELAKMLAYNCVRNNTPLESLHDLGPTPSSKTGDYSDVKVVTPYGEIPWNGVTRITDAEMKELMIGVTDAIYTALIDPGYFLEPVPAYWQEPKHL